MRQFNDIQEDIMDMIPGLKVALMGTFGYLVGGIAQTNPKIVALSWAVAEVIKQIFERSDARLIMLNHVVFPILGGLLPTMVLLENALIDSGFMGDYPLKEIGQKMCVIFSLFCFVSDYLSYGFKGCTLKAEFIPH